MPWIMLTVGLVVLWVGVIAYLLVLLHAAHRDTVPDDTRLFVPTRPLVSRVLVALRRDPTKRLK